MPKIPATSWIGREHVGGHHQAGSAVIARCLLADDFDIRVFLRDVFTAFDAVDNGLNRRAIHQQHFAFAAHLAEQVFAGGFPRPGWRWS